MSSSDSDDDKIVVKESKKLPAKGSKKSPAKGSKKSPAKGSKSLLAKGSKKYNKADLLLIGELRAKNSGKQFKMSEWKKKKVGELKEELIPVSDEENKLLASHKAKQDKFKDVAKETLKKTLMIHGHGKGSALSKGEMISLIMEKKLELLKPLTLDSDQSNFVKKMVKSSSRDVSNSIVVSAGPGSGKTNTMAHLIVKLSQQGKRVLTVMFNVSAEKNIMSRIEAFDGKITRIPGNFNPWMIGSGGKEDLSSNAIVCQTFNKLAYRIIKSAPKKRKTSSDVQSDDAKTFSIEDEIENMFNLDDDDGAKYSRDELDIEDGKDEFKMPELGDQIPAATSIMKEHPIIRKFDYLIIDEAQDICGKYQDFVSELNNIAKYVIFVGDPRQEIYPGSRFFSDLYSTSPEEYKFTMRYNHRSCSKIIEMLNLYSKSSFTTLHHDQLIGTTPEPNDISGVKLITCDREVLSYAIATELCKYTPNDVYIITPVTVRKFGLGPVFMGVRNALVEAGCVYPLVTLSDEGKYNPSDQIYYAGSARKLKGTERKTVILVGAEILYTQFGINEIEYRKLLFVCLSRAIENLIIIIPKYSAIDPESPFAKVIRCDNENEFKFVAPAIIQKKLLTTLRIKDDLCASKTINIDYKELKPEPDDNIPKGSHTAPVCLFGDKKESSIVSSIMKIKHNEDFVGLYIEALVALKMGANVSKWQEIIKNPEKNIRVLSPSDTITSHSMGTFYETHKDGTIILLLRHGEKPSVPTELIECKDAAYVLTVLNYSAQIGKWWIASKTVLDAAKSVATELDKVIESVCNYIATKVPLDSGTIPKWGENVDKSIKCERSPLTSAWIKGIADLMFPNLVVELKFAMHRIEHLRQTAIYSALQDRPGLLINLFENKVYTVEPVIKTELDQYGRLLLALKNGKSSNLGKRIHCDKDLFGSVLVALDVETDGFPPHAPLLEVGACAWYFGTEDIEGTFSMVINDAKTFDRAEASTIKTKLSLASQLTGILPPPNVEKSGNLLRKNVTKWYNTLSGRKIGLVWGDCKDFEAAGLNSLHSGPSKVINVYRLYKDWLELNGCKRHANTKLEDAVSHLFKSDFVFHPHRAYEDVCATVAIFNAIVDFGGSL